MKKRKPQISTKNLKPSFFPNLSTYFSETLFLFNSLL